ncbi:unnamed protein product [Urochloa humidicola]
MRGKSPCRTRLRRPRLEEHAKAACGSGANAFAQHWGRWPWSTLAVSVATDAPRKWPNEASTSVVMVEGGSCKRPSMPSGAEAP